MRTIAILTLSLATGACVSSGDVDLLHREISDVSRQVEELGRQSSGKEDLQQVSREMAAQSSQALRSNADIQAELRTVRERISTLQASLEATNQRLQALSTELAATRDRLSTAVTSAPALAAPLAGPPAAGTSVDSAKPPAPPVHGNEPAQLYNAAYEDYLRSNFDLAIQGFAEYARRYPDTDLADNALYWVGECHYSKREFKEAIEAFTRLLNTYKTSDKAAAALLKKGLAFLELQDRAQATINLQYVVFEYPDSKEAELARTRLQALGVKVK
ncbi:MAG: tol-pal system protein YbgF [Acidobacteria bacterium]|nr:tol-pal system protein YbgF [Acidobacteriota bacterium]